MFSTRTKMSKETVYRVYKEYCSSTKENVNILQKGELYGLTLLGVTYGRFQSYLDVKTGGLKTVIVNRGVKPTILTLYKDSKLLCKEIVWSRLRAYRKNL